MGQPRRPSQGRRDRRPPRTELENALHDIRFEALVSREADGWATPAEADALAAEPHRWVTTLHRLVAETEDAVERAASLPAEQRAQVRDDLIAELDRLDAAVERLTGVPSPRRAEAAAPGPPAGADGSADEEAEAPAPGMPVLQASWSAGDVVVWAGAPGSTVTDRDALDALLAEAGAAAIAWSTHRKVPLPDGGRALAVAAPIGDVLGWLVGVGAGQLANEAGPSVRWMGAIAARAARLVAQGQMVPTITRVGRGKGGQRPSLPHRVRWIAATLDRTEIDRLTAAVPGAVLALEPGADRERLCRTVLDAAVDVICTTAASRLVVPATPPVARTRPDVREAVLAGLAGRPFEAVPRVASDVTNDLARWAAPVAVPTTVGLTVRLDPPEADGGWLLTVDATGIERQPVQVERALVAPRGAGKEAEAQLVRLERLLPVLRRPTTRRGQVVLSADEAWDLMSRTGPALVAAGFHVRVPLASTRRPQARLALHADAVAGDTRTGARQLADVRWSVLLGDVELGPADIARLAKEATPLLKVGDRWVELDQHDLVAARDALAAHAGVTQMSGADILRHAVGLEGGAFGGAVAVKGTGWAVDLVRGATEEPPAPLGAPEGFVGTLRDYQAEGRGWLHFLDEAGLGGILAMDMGLGKTPTVLAHLLDTRDRGPVLVITPPAVLGNWAAEAARFAPGLRVRVHHGSGRADADDLDREVDGTDVLLTTYGTAVRDVDALARVDWARVVVDEAQTIKNPASDVAQQLRRIPAASRLALTGTPVENGLGDLWAILDYVNPGLVGGRNPFIEQLSASGTGKRGAAEAALHALNGLLVFRRTKLEPAIAAELPDKIDELDHCGMTPEQIGLYQAVLDRLVLDVADADDRTAKQGNVLAAITALKQICNHPAAYLSDDTGPLDGRSGKLARLEELVDAVFAAGERMLVFTHFATWGDKLATYLTERTGTPVRCYHGGLARGARDRIVSEFQESEGPGVLVLSIKAGGSGLNLTAANHVVLYDRWWNPAVEDQARDRAWRIGQRNMVISHRLVCPGTIDERVEEVVAGKRHIADLVLPASSSLADLGAEELRRALGLRPDALVDIDGDTVELAEPAA